MAQQQFYTILTNTGKAKLANSNVFGTKVNLKTLVVGDGNGKYYNPTENQEKLVNEVWRGNIKSTYIDKDNPNWIRIETVIPSNYGGFMIREVGALDEDGALILIAKYPETYKPIIDDGATKDLRINIILEVSNAENVTLKIDPYAITATKKDIDDLENKIKNIKVPVTKVNEKIGDVVLTAEDIKCKNGTTIESSLDDLKTKDKSLEGKINDLDTNKVNNTDYSKLNLYIGITSGTSTSYTKTISNGQKTYVDGQQITIVPHVDCGDNPTLNLNSIGAVNLVNSDGNLKIGDLKANMPYSFVRVGSNFFIRSGGNPSNFPSWFKFKNDWIRCANMIAPISGNTAVSLDRYIYTLGGTKLDGSYGDSKRFEAYNVDDNTWEKKADLPISTYNMTAQSYKGKIYAMGGWQYNTTNYEYNPSTDSWVQKASMTQGRESLVSGIIDRFIYAIGGVNFTTILGINEVYDTLLNSWTTKATIPFKSSGSASATLGTNIYVMAGYDGKYYMNDNQMYDSKINTWTAKAYVPKICDHARAEELNGKIYFMGGYVSKYEMLDNFFMYDPLLNTWTDIGRINNRKSSFGIAKVDKNIYMLGGYGFGTDKLFDKVECYIPQ